MEEGAAPAFVEDAVRVICENGKEISWDDIMAFTKFKTVPDALARVKECSLDVFSYYKNELLCVTLLAKLIDFTALNEDIITRIIQHLIDDAKQKGILEKCAGSPCWVSMEHSVVSTPVVALIRRARNVGQYIPNLVVMYAYDWWCIQTKFFKRTAIQDCLFCHNYYCLAHLLNCIRPPSSILPRIGRYSLPFWKVIDQYGAAGDACRAMAWACSKENTGGVWYDLWVCVAERWDYRAESWEERGVSEKRLKL
jgi:hypothetical protein